MSLGGNYNGIWQGPLTGLVGGFLGSYIEGEWGAIFGGISSGSLGAALNGASPNEILRAGFLGGLLSWGGYKIQKGLRYMRYKRNNSELSHQGFNKLNNISQRSHARGREAAGWILKNGDVSKKVNWDAPGGVDIPERPVGGRIDFHTHPNEPRCVEYHSPGDIEKGLNLVIGWKNIWEPKFGDMPADYHNFSDANKIIFFGANLVKSSPNYLYSFPYFLFYFGN